MKIVTTFLYSFISATVAINMIAGSNDPWTGLNGVQGTVTTIMISSLMAIDVFFAISAFLAFYQISQIYDINDKLSAKDIFKIYGKRLLRILPLYYLLFFIGWQVVPHLASGPLWFEYSNLFATCNESWWANVLMIGNLIPWTQDIRYGCMDWAFAVACDIQLYIFMPFFVMLYKKNKKASIAWHCIMLLGGIAIMCCLADAYNFTAGGFSNYNYVLFAYFIEKPWTKFHANAIGCLFAIFYMHIL